MDKLKLLGEKILVEVAEKSKTASGLIVTESDELQSFKKGKVVAVGPGKWTADHGREPMLVEVGNTVLFNYAQEVSIDGKKYWLTSEPDIAVVFTE